VKEKWIKKKAVVTPLQTLFAAMRKGSLFTRLSFIIMGFGQIACGQIVKGILYMLTQAAFILYMIFVGGGHIAHLFSGDLGVRLSGEQWNESLQMFEKIKGDNSFLILLYGVVSLVLFLLFTWVWFLNVKGCYENDLRIAKGESLPSIRQDLHALLNERFYVPLLFFPFLGLLVFTVMPLIFMALIAFTNYDYAHMPPGRLFDWSNL
jgi:arabinogalactan oligomer/maltooligosaccharide transport system permease protein